MARKITLITDHKPLLAILGPTSPVPTLAAARMQRQAIVLSAYDYDLEYRKSADHANCDVFSRLPHKDSSVGGESTNYAVSAIGQGFLITAKEIGKATQVNPVRCKVFQFVVSGCPESCEDVALKPYHNYRHELSCEQDYVLWGSRVVIPPVFRNRMLKELHWEHPGISGMRQLHERAYGGQKMDEDIERTGELVRCVRCYKYPIKCTTYSMEVANKTISACSH